MNETQGVLLLAVQLVILGGLFVVVHVIRSLTDTMRVVLASMRALLEYEWKDDARRAREAANAAPALRQKPNPKVNG